MPLAMWSFLLLCGVALGGCELIDVRASRLGLNSALFTEADLRMINAAPLVVGPDGRTHPQQITCAEPSPDVAKAISTAFGAGAAVTVNINGPGLPADPAQIAAAVSRSRSEAFAQLGERMASIQLLRDGLYRACEGFQNGALDKISYSLVLSKIGDTMVSMLGSELIAGEFGRAGASAGGSAAASGSASFGPPTKEELQAAKDKVATAEKDAQKAEVTQKETTNALLQGKAEQAAVDSARLDTENKQVELAAAKRELVGLASAGATSRTTASGQGIGGLTANVGDTAANRISDIVRQYLQSPNLHSMMTACVAAMSDPSYNASALSQFCVRNMDTLAHVLTGAYVASYGEIAQDKNDDRQREMFRQIRVLQGHLARAGLAPAAGKAKP